MEDISLRNSAKFDIRKTHSLRNTAIKYNTTISQNEQSKGIEDLKTWFLTFSGSRLNGDWISF